MGSKISDYDIALMERIERIREKYGFSQEVMAEKMGIGTNQYKRYVYREAKIPAERVANLTETLGLDPDYILTGSTRGARQFIKFMLTATDLEIAEMLMKLAEIYREMYFRKNGIDYIDRDFNLIEKNTR